MMDLPGLQQRRSSRSFANWDDFVPADLVAQSEEAVNRLIDNLIALGPSPTKEQIQAEMDTCVRRFNELDQAREDPWIETDEREDIGKVLWDLVDLCGFKSSQDWLRERDW